MQIKTIMVVGAGQMGSGIALVAAQSGLQVVLNDVEKHFLDKSLEKLTQLLERQLTKGTISQDTLETTLSHISPSTTLEDVAKVDCVIEAAYEKMSVKANIFETLSSLAPAHTILASNTSSLPITELAARTNRPDRVIGMHFMNPVTKMVLVEVIRGIATSDETFQIVFDLALRFGKQPVAVNDSPGFVSNRVLMPMINEAICCVHEGVAEAEAVDQVMRLGMNHPMGPLALADFIGLDTCLAIMEVLHDGFADSKYRPCPLLRKMVKAGWLGKKSGKGFYEYGPGGDK